MELNEKYGGTDELTPVEREDIPEDNPALYDDIEVVVGDNTIRTRQPDSVSRHRRHWEQYQRRRKRLIILSCVLTVVVILASLAWYFYSPVYGYGDLSETVSSDMINKARSRFTVEEYNDSKEGITLTYHIYIPFEYDRTKHYPLMFCIADAASVGRNTEKPLRDNFGGAIWATDSEQEKHPCFVVVPCYPEAVTGQGVGTFTRYTEITARMIDSIIRKYHINASEVYATGQGMGASMLLYLAADEPDRFASLLLVDGGAEIANMTDLSTTRFISIASGGDDEAIEAQQLIQQKLRSKGVTYGEITDLDASAPVDELNAAANDMFRLKHDQNFITWRAGSVGFSLFFGEQRMSYRFGYKVDAVRDWIMEDRDIDMII